MLKKEESLKEYFEVLYRKNDAIIRVVAMIIIVLIVYIALSKSDDVEAVEEDVAEDSQISNGNNGEVYTANKKVNEKKVYISGEVNNSGVYTIDEGDRIENIINYAGGVTDKASLEYVNLSEIVEDEQHIIIPSVEGESELYEVGEANKKININKANVEQLTQINGVGEATAQKIVDYREKYGKFKNKEEIMNVAGIGEKTYENFKDEIDIK